MKEKNADTETTRQKTSEWRCDCGKLLFKGVFLIGVIEVKCTRCKRIVYLQECESFTTSEPSFMLILSTTGEILSASDGVRDTLGYPPEECTGNNMQQYVTRNTKVVMGFWLKKIEKLAMNSNPHLFFPLKIRHKDGSWVAFTIFAQCIGHQDKQFIFAVAEKGGEALRRYEARLKQDKITDQHKQYTAWDFAIDLQGNVIECSPLNSFGIKPSLALKKTIFELFGAQSDFGKHEVIARLEAGENLLRKITVTTGNNKSEVYDVSVTADILTNGLSRSYNISLSHTTS